MSSHDNSDLCEEDLNKLSSGKFFCDQDDLIDNENEIDNENNADDENNPDNLDKEEGKDNKGKKNQENEPDKEQGNQELELDNQDLEEQEEDSSDSNNDKRFPDVEPNDWIHWFCKLRGNEFFAEIDENFIKNEENLVGIKYKKEHIKTILSERPKKIVELNRELIEELQEVRDIYGAIHKRFLLHLWLVFLESI